ncbi:MAG: SpoIID/LytB domain-containing protein [Eubacteriales bacterium]
MKEKDKKIVSIIIIILLLPYVLTVLIKGEDALPMQVTIEEEMVNVRIDGRTDSVFYDTFLIGILAKEIPQEFSLEAMKAQAIIIRTRLELERLESGEQEEYIFEESFYTTEDIQRKWSNAESLEIYSQLKEAVEETSAETLVYDGELAKTPYHLLSTGMTRDGNEVFLSEEYPYLVAVSCPLDIEADKEVAIQTVTYEELIEALGLTLEHDLTFDEINVLEIDNSNYVLSVEVQGNIINGEVFRDALYLKSSAFSFQANDENSIQITTQGVGHGLGLSQNTAHYMGLEGKSYVEILKYFYVGCEIITK